MFRERLLILWWQIKRNLVAAALGIAGILLVLTGFVTFIISGKEKEEIVFESAEKTASSDKIFFDIAGAVVNPGVYEASSDARLINALVLAGGLSASADREWVSRNLNLAKKISDGAKIYIPTKEESIKSTTSTKTITGGEVAGVQSDNLININQASLVQLDKLPGIGPVTGQKIIDNRPYNDVNELLTRKVVGKKVYEQIKEKITTY